MVFPETENGSTVIPSVREDFEEFANNFCAVKQPTSEQRRLQTRLLVPLSSRWHRKPQHPDAHFEKKLQPAVSN